MEKPLFLSFPTLTTFDPHPLITELTNIIVFSVSRFASPNAFDIFFGISVTHPQQTHSQSAGLRVQVSVNSSKLVYYDT